MAGSAVTRPKGGANPLGRVLLIETAGADVAKVARKLSDENVRVEISDDLNQAFRKVNQGQHDLVIAGPRLHTVDLRRISALAGHEQSNLRSPALNLGSLYQANIAKESLASLVHTAAAFVESPQTFALVCDPLTGAPDLASLCIAQTCPPKLAATLRHCFDRMQANENAAAMTDGGEEDMADAGIYLFMIPVFYNSDLLGMLGIVCRQPAKELASGRLAMLRRLSQISSSFLAALRNAELLRNRTDEVEDILHLKSHLMSNMCHESRSLLAAVRGYSRRILDGRAGAINDAQHDHLTVVLRNCNKLLDLVSYSAPFAVEQQLRVERFDLRETWRHALKRLRRRGSDESIRIIERIPSEPFNVIADKERLEVMFDILLANVEKCVTDDGRVIVQFLHATHGGTTVKLFLPGTVLPAQLLDTAFDHCGHTEAEAHQDRPALSGLSLVHDLVWLHGGRISVASNSGEGTVFTFSLPSPRSPAENSRSWP